MKLDFNQQSRARKLSLYLGLIFKTIVVYENYYYKYVLNLYTVTAFFRYIELD